MSLAGTGRGRGRGRLNQPIEPPSPGDVPRPMEPEATASINEWDEISSLPGPLSESTTSELIQIERARRGNPPRVLSSAPRGIGIQILTSELGSLQITPSTSGQSTAQAALTSSKEEMPSPLKNKQGTSGNPINLIANCVKLLVKSTWELLQYHVNFYPEITNKGFRREIIAQHRMTLRDIAFDGGIIYTFNDLGDSMALIGKDPGVGTDVTVSLRKVARHSSESPVFFHIANLIVRKLLELSGLKMIGRHYYQFDRRIDLDRYKLTLFPGFLTNINIYERSLMVNVDLSQKILNKTTVYQRLQDIFSRYQDGKEAQDAAMKEIVGQIIVTNYASATYKVHDIAWDKSPSDSFTLRNGTECSFVKYYEDKYRLRILDSNQPLLVSKPSRKMRRSGITAPLLLVPELCCVTGISEAMRSDGQFMKEMSSLIQIDAQDRCNRLRGLLAGINQNQQCQEELKKWDIELDHDLVQVEGRLLDTEYILYFDNSVRYNLNDGEWSREARVMRHINAKSLINWIVIFPARDQQVSLMLIDALLRVCKPFGMHVEYPHIQMLTTDRPEAYLRALQDSVVGNIDLVLCVLSNGRKDRYDLLKKYLCLDNPVPSQMVQVKTIIRQNQLMSVATKIGIQINAKLGGELWSIQIPTKTLMVIGIDSYHDPKRKNRSVTAFVSSINPPLTKFYSRVIHHQTRQELLEGFNNCINDALNAYYHNNNALPEKIVIYRDGISDTQFSVTVDYELPQIIQSFSKFASNYEPKLAVIAVKRRGSVRLFHQNGRNIANPPPGTILDHTVTNADSYDFYLISQCAKQGTVSPTHYNVIWDRTTFKVDHMQRLTFKLCHIYYNWPGTVRVPAVCQYAHKLAYLVGQSLHQDFNHALADKLFYL